MINFFGKLSCDNHILFILPFCFLALISPIQAEEAGGAVEDAVKVAPEMDQVTEESLFLCSILGNVDATYRGLSWVTFQKMTNTTPGRGNTLLDIQKSSFTSEFRPDFYLAYHAVDMGLKPRAIFEWEQRDIPQESVSAKDSEFFINEWFVRYALDEQFLVSYGRENLQWGPSFLLSPSNPFFKENGRLQLNKEVRGRDFAKITWLPSPSWTVSTIANTSAGATVTGSSFTPVYAVKLDWTGEVSYASMIASHQEGEGHQLGAFGGWTVTDGLLLHAEGMVEDNSDTLSPHHGAEIPTTLKGRTTNQYESIAIIGWNYTLEAGPTLTMEYLHNSKGYSTDEAKKYYSQLRRAQDTTLAAQNSGRSNLSFLRSHYLMFQIVHTDSSDLLSLTGRWLYNVEDSSSQLYGNVVYSLDDHLELFTTALISLGDEETEFGSQFTYQVNVGVRFVF